MTAQSAQKLQCCIFHEFHLQLFQRISYFLIKEWFSISKWSLIPGTFANFNGGSSKWEEGLFEKVKGWDYCWVEDGYCRN